MTGITWRPPTQNRLANSRLVACEDAGVRYVSWGWWDVNRKAWINEATDRPFKRQPYAVADSLSAPRKEEVVRDVRTDR